MTQSIHQTFASGRSSTIRDTALLTITLAMTTTSAQDKPTTGSAPVNGLKMYYEV